jgi:D-alanyl-D-alanine carboxypeptidase
VPLFSRLACCVYLHQKQTIMKRYFVVILMLIAVMDTACNKIVENLPGKGGRPHENRDHPLKDSIQAIMNRYVTAGIPGIQVAVKNSEGWYFAEGGYGSAESKTPIRPGAATWLFSITKPYTASLVMKQKEKGLINLDLTIAHYLPDTIAQRITGSDRITVRNLLNHSSGLADFIELPDYLAAQFTHPLEQPAVPEIVQMVMDQDLEFEPGTDFNYSNTNYLLLQIILEKLTGKTYEQLLSDGIIEPLHLQQTYFHVSNPQISSLGFPEYYVDLKGDGQLTNATRWNNALGNGSYGWGGIAATPSDAILFFEALMKGQVVNKASLQEMKTWIQGKASSIPDYGLGMEYFQYAEGSTPQMGHEGDGIGCSTMIMYVPDNDTYLFINTTVGRKLGGPFLTKIIDLKNELSSYVARWRK